MFPALLNQSEVPMLERIGVLAAPWSLVALVIFVLLLPLLQRRFRIFTRGTISFMVAALMIFTLADGFLYLHDIRNQEDALKERARFTSVASLIQTFLEQGPTAAIDQLPRNDYREAVAESLRELDRDLAEEFGELGDAADGAARVQLVALDVGRNLVHKLRLLNPRHYGPGEEWGFEALVDDGRRWHLVQGVARVIPDLDGGALVIDVSGKHGQDYDRGDDRAARLFLAARAYRSPVYGCSVLRGRNVLARNP